MIRLPLILFAIFFFATLRYQGAIAAEFRLTPDHPQGCQFELSGQIVSGDLQRLQKFARSELSKLKLSQTWREDVPELGDRPFMCLNSPGGSLGEAVKMAEFLRGPEDVIESTAILQLRNLGTVVGDGAVCESACAVLFMAGQTSEGQHGRFPDRYLHKNGLLGFHAPSIEVAEGDYSQGAVTQSFDIAVNAIARLMRNGRIWGFSPDLLEEMLNTPPTDMAYVSPISGAEEFGIEVIGIGNEDFPKSVAKHHIVKLCRLAFERSMLQARSKLQHRQIPFWQYEGQLFRGDSYNRFQRFAKTGSASVFQYGIFDMGGFECNGKVYPGGGE